jgi:AmiR/NasT family two-component response regulator
MPKLSIVTNVNMARDRPMTKQRPRILLIEDNDTTRMMLVALLSSGDYEVLEAADGISALVAAEHNPPDLAVLDLHLPDMPGLEIAGLFHQRIPFLVLTVDAHSERVRQCIELGALGYLVKPPEPDALLRQVRIALERGRENQNLRRALQETPIINKALGILMAQNGFSEEQAYQNLLSRAMARKRRAADLAREVIDAFHTLTRQAPAKRGATTPPTGPFR